MINLRCRCEDRNIVAILTNVTRRNVIRGFAYGFHTVVATDTVACDVVVIEVRGCPGYGCVAVVAGITTGNMIGRFAGNNRVVVTAETGTDDLQVIDLDCGCKHHYRMTVLADI